MASKEELMSGIPITYSVGSHYELWKVDEGAVLELTDGAKKFIKKMQATVAGIAYLQGPAADHEGETPEGGTLIDRRVFLELEAKGLVTFHEDGRKLSLTHYGWILNPDTGMVDKVG